MLTLDDKLAKGARFERRVYQFKEDFPWSWAWRFGLTIAEYAFDYGRGDDGV